MTKHKLRIPLLASVCLAAALSLASCATPTPYQPISAASRAQGGYSETRLAPDQWRVTFAGNSLTSRETVEGYLLYRAAELTLEQRRDWFEIVNRDTQHEIQRNIVRDPMYDPWWGYPSWRPYWRYYEPQIGWRSWYPWYGDPFWARSVNVQTVERYEASADIVMHSGTRPAGDGNIFDAREVIARLEPRIQRPK
jgi:hypothetical protein